MAGMPYDLTLDYYAKLKARADRAYVQVLLSPDVARDMHDYARESGKTISASVCEAWAAARSEIRKLKPAPRGVSRRKVGIKLDPQVWHAIRAYAAAENIPVSMAVRRAWRLAKAEIKALPTRQRANGPKESSPGGTRRGKKVTVYIPAGMMEDVQAQASSNTDSVARVIRRAWLLARDRIRAIPSPPVRMRHEERRLIEMIMPVAAIRSEARRTGLSVSSLLAFAWQNAREQIRAMPADGDEA